MIKNKKKNKNIKKYTTSHDTPPPQKKITESEQKDKQQTSNTKTKQNKTKQSKTVENNQLVVGFVPTTTKSL